jgi:hypothetical protein
MAFNIEKWKQSLQQSLPGFRDRMKRAGVDSSYCFIAASAFLPIAQAMQTGNLEPLLFANLAARTCLRSWLPMTALALAVFGKI